MICKDACAGSVQSEKYERQCLGTVIPKTIESRCKMLIEKMNFIVKHSHFCHVTWIFTNPMLARESSWLEVERQCYHALGRTLIEEHVKRRNLSIICLPGQLEGNCFPGKNDRELRQQEGWAGD